MWTKRSECKYIMYIDIWPEEERDFSNITSIDFPNGADSQTRQKDLKAYFIIPLQTCFQPSGNLADM